MSASKDPSWTFFYLVIIFLIRYWLAFRINIKQKTFVDTVTLVIFFLIIRHFSIILPLANIAGALLNMAVTYANNGMPVSVVALKKFSGPPYYYNMDLDLRYGYFKLEENHRFKYLADIFYVPRIGVLSLGDMFIIFGQVSIVIKYFLNL